MNKVYCSICKDFLRMGSARERDVCDRHATEEPVQFADAPDWKAALRRTGLAYYGYPRNV